MRLRGLPINSGKRGGEKRAKRGIGKHITHGCGIMIDNIVEWVNTATDEEIQNYIRYEVNKPNSIEEGERLELQRELGEYDR